MYRLFDQSSSALYFNSLFSALQTVAAVWNRSLAVTPNQHIEIAQALRQSGVDFTFTDIDFYGLQLTSEGNYSILTTDYAGIMPEIDRDIELWTNGAGYLDREPGAEIIVIDLATLNPDNPAGGALVWCKDSVLAAQMHRYATLGVEKAVAWNDRVASGGINGLMQPLALSFWEAHLEVFTERLKTCQETATLYADALTGNKLVDLLPTQLPRFFPLKLIPELYCPKEEIYDALHEAGIAAKVPFKPLFKYKLFQSKNLTGANEFYKAVIALPVHGKNIQEAAETVRIFAEVLEHYRYRSCSF